MYKNYTKNSYTINTNNFAPQSQSNWMIQFVIQQQNQKKDNQQSTRLES
jgi:hypothetical protein